MINVDRHAVQSPVIGKNYRTDAVYDALGEIFHNKCYLCGTQRTDATNFQIEHLLAHKDDPQLKFAWENLYLACGDTCNQYKGSRYDDILDPCNPDDDVEQMIRYELESIGIGHIPHFSASDESVFRVVNSCELLDRIHNGSHNSKARRKTADLRNAIHRRAKILEKAIGVYYQADNANNQSEKQRAEIYIEMIVSRRAPYTMLMRSIASKHQLDYLFD